MNWTQWRRGLIVAALTGGLTGAVAMGVGATAKQALWIVGLTAGKDMVLYLTNPSYRKQVLDGLPHAGDDTEQFQAQSPKQQPAQQGIETKP